MRDAPEDRALEDLRREARVFARYILGRETAPHLIERYARAHEALGPALRSERGARAVALAARRPWLLPFLDAAASLVEPQGLLRKKLLLMLAILETSTEHVEVFAPRPRPRPLVLARLFFWGAAAALKAAAGIPLYFALARRP
ncbi:MAG: hypothetical protein ACUVYA_00720 [Planctomycetota bacterium]